MQLTNPAWIHHSGGAIYSIDIHPSGTKLVSCGQGSEGGSGLVVVWNLKPVISAKKSQDANCTKLLSRMLHQSCVNCVRWSPDGDLLACAGDERSLTVWQYGGRINSAGTIGSSETANVEKYREKHHLNGHTMDVLHVEWSKDGRYLASCGMDNSVIIWDAHQLPNIVMALNSECGGHTGIVKGISWDPIGKFLATQSADKSIKIWTTDSWHCIRTITKPFDDSSQTTMFSRLDWSPDGTYLIAPGAMNNTGPTAQLIRRKDWDISLDLVGHRKAVTVVRACPRLIEYYNHKNTKLLVSLFAVGSRDKALSVWLIPNVDRPLVVVHKLFKHSILDFSWRDFHLVVCSMDGSVKSILFDQKEVGRLLSNLEMGDTCEKLYSRRPRQYCDASNGYTPSPVHNKGNVFVDDLAALKMQKEIEKWRKEELWGKESKEGSKNGVNELKLASDNDNSKNSLSEQSSAMRDIDADKGSSLTTGVVSVSSKPQKVPEVQQITTQCEVRTKSGKRRIQPIFVASTCTSDSDGHLPSLTEQNVHSIIPSTSRLTSTCEMIEEQSLEAISSTSSVSKMESDEEYVPNKFPHVSQRPELRQITLPESMNVTVDEGRTIVLPVPAQKRQLSVPLSPKILQQIDKVDVMNEFPVAPAVTTTKVSGMQKDSVRWSTHCDSVACIVAANNEWTVIGCYDRSVIFLSTESGRLHMQIVIDSVPSTSVLHRSYYCLLSCKGFIYVWNIEKRVAALSRFPVGDVIDVGVRITRLLITDTGVPVLALSSGRTFAYSHELKCWQLVSNTSSLASRLSKPVPHHLIKDSTSLSLSSIVATGKCVPIRVESSIQDFATYSLLEERIEGCRLLQSASEFRHYVNIYVELSVKNGAVSKVKELLLSILHESSDYVCGLKKRQLIGEVLPVLKKNPKFEDLTHVLETQIN